MCTRPRGYGDKLNKKWDPMNVDRVGVIKIWFKPKCIKPTSSIVETDKAKIASNNIYA